MNKVVARASTVWVPNGGGTCRTDLVELRLDRAIYFIRDYSDLKNFYPIEPKDHENAKTRLDNNGALPITLEEPYALVDAIEQRDSRKASRFLAELVKTIEEAGLKGKCD